MKKTDTGKIDRNTNINDYFSSQVYFPNSAVKAQTGVEIIEIHSSNTSDSNNDDTLNSHAWSYVDKKRPYTKQNNCNINNSARERRRMKNKVCPERVNQRFDYLPYENTIFSHTENLDYSYNSLRHNVAKEKALHYNQLNQFTILNDEFLDSDQSLSDNDNSLEIIQCGDVILEDDLYINKDTPESVTKNDKKLDNTVKRTIWIYSFKNKNLLSEDIKQPINSFNEDSTSSSSTENFQNTSEYTDRTASPIPPSYIPKLDLYAAATLPTVREVVEPYQFTVKDGGTCTTKKDLPKSLAPFNNWFINKNHDSKDESLSKMNTNVYSDHKTISSHNVINWMSLSPRNHKRNLCIPNTKKENNELNQYIQKQKQDTAKDIPNIDGDLTYIKTNSNEVINEVILRRDKGLNIDEQLKINSIDEKGDYNKVLQLKKPFIQFNKVLGNEININTIDKLNSDEWIEDTNVHTNEIKLEIDKDSDKDTARREEVPKYARSKLLTKNMSLLKPVEWSQYLPITESIPSLHLSLPSDINEEKQSWFKYFIKYITCCKKCK